MTDPFQTGLPSDASFHSWQAALLCMFSVSLVWAFWPQLRSLLRGCAPRLDRRIKVRLLLVLPVTVALMVGGTKGPWGYASARVSQFITALRSGLVIDDSGVVARFAETEAIRYFNEESQSIIDAAHDSVTDSVARITALGVALTGTPYTCAYIAADLPRADPHQHTNHNVAATIERVDSTGSVVRLWVWFSEEPFERPNLKFQASVADNVWINMSAITNSWPNTETVNGIACVRYDFAMPGGMSGTPLRPTYELSWGGYGTNDYLIVPAGGVLVSTNNVETLPRSGWVRSWPAPWGTNLAVRFAGGVAIEANWMGTNYVGRSL